MVTKEAKRNTKVSVSISANTLEAIESLQKDLPAGDLPDMIRYLMMRGIETITAERARRVVLSNPRH